MNIETAAAEFQAAIIDLPETFQGQFTISGLPKTYNEPYPSPRRIPAGEKALIAAVRLYWARRAHRMVA